MTASTIVKINFLVLGLGLTLYFMYAVQTKGLPPIMQAFLGVGY